MSQTNFDVASLRTFVVGMELGSFAKAADRVGRSTSAVSAQIKKLEEQSGAPLFKICTLTESRSVRDAAAPLTALRSTSTICWGAKVTEAMGIGDIGVSLWGECEEQSGMHLGARGFVHAELVNPTTGSVVGADDDE